MSLVWGPGHCNIRGNEEANKFASDVADYQRARAQGPEPYFGIKWQPTILSALNERIEKKRQAKKIIAGFSPVRTN